MRGRPLGSGRAQDAEGQAVVAAIVHHAEHAEWPVVHLVDGQIAGEISQRLVEVGGRDAVYLFFPRPPRPSSGWWPRGRRHDGHARGARRRLGRPDHPRPRRGQPTPGHGGCNGTWARPGRRDRRRSDRTQKRERSSAKTTETHRSQGRRARRRAVLHRSGPGHSLQAQPIDRLAETSARLCRLLREEVTEQLAVGSPALTALAADWRKLLFPDASDAQFADGYAQAVTFGLLMARARKSRSATASTASPDNSARRTR